MKIGHELRDPDRFLLGQLRVVVSQALPETRDELMARTGRMVRALDAGDAIDESILT